MDLKFYLNKFLKADNIEHYTFKTLLELKTCYEDMLETTEGYDPDFPMSNFGDKKKGDKIKGQNIYTIGVDNDIPDGGEVYRKPVAAETEDKRKNSSAKERALAFLKAKGKL